MTAAEIKILLKTMPIVNMAMGIFVKRSNYSCTEGC